MNQAGAYKWIMRKSGFIFKLKTNFSNEQNIHFLFFNTLLPFISC